jgi:hypothetical protein
MKRSAQVALVLMGVTATTATAAYIMPPRGDCRPQQGTPSTTATPAQALPPGVTPKQPEPCQRRSTSSSHYRSWGDWSWNSNRQQRAASPNSVSTALTSSGGRVAAFSGSSSSSSSSSFSSSVARGGFGSTGHGMSGGS